MPAFADGRRRRVADRDLSGLDLRDRLGTRRIRTLRAAGTVPGIRAAHRQPQRARRRRAAPANGRGRQPVSLRPGRAALAGWLASVAAGDPASLEPATCPEADNIDKSGLDVRTHALVRLAALVAADGSPAAYDQAIATALDHGVTLDEIAG